MIYYFIAIVLNLLSYLYFFNQRYIYLSAYTYLFILQIQYVQEYIVRRQESIWMDNRNQYAYMTGSN